MKFVSGPIPPSSDPSLTDDNWTPLREPSPGVFVAQVLLLALPLLGLALRVLLQLKGHLHTHPTATILLVCSFAMIVPVHELIHAFAYPGGLRSRHLVMGVWLRRGLAYVVYDAPLPRNRVLIMLLAPFATLTVVLGMIVIVVPSQWRLMALLVMLVHTAICLGDFLTYSRLVRQVPVCAQVQNDGWVTYWKLISEVGRTSCDI